MSSHTKLIGSPAPAFAAVDQNGNQQALTDYKGAWLILYFYPKDGTPICTEEACYFRDDYKQLSGQTDVSIVGVSQDDTESHKQFATAHQLPFALLSDPDLTITKAYGCYQPEDTPEREYLGIIRSTFLIDPEGIVRKEYRFVIPAEQTPQIVQDLQALQK